LEHSDPPERFPGRLNVYQCFIRFKKNSAKCLTTSDDNAMLYRGARSPTRAYLAIGFAGDAG